MGKNTQNKKTNGTDGTLLNKKEKFIKQLSENLGNVTEACKELNIGRRTYYNWRELDEEFKERCDNVPEELLDMAENSLLSEIQNKNSKGHITATIFYLKTKGKKRGYNESLQLDVVKPFDRIDLEGI